LAQQPAIRFRQAAVDDLAAILAIQDQAAAAPWSGRQWRDSLESHSVTLLDVNGTVAGYAVVASVLDERELLNIAVMPAQQGQGLGGILLDRCLAKDGTGAVRMLLEVRSGNQSAIALYRSRGFVKAGIRKGYYPAGAGREDAWVMVYEFQ
jgi:ribosomal-protein-alanine N-acetyltransferase